MKVDIELPGEAHRMPMRPRQGEHRVGYGFFKPEGNREGQWTMSPLDCFRATKIYAWTPEDARAARIESLLIGSDEQLEPGGSLPADLFTSWVSPRQFLEMYGGLEDPAPGFYRVLMKNLPAQPHFLVALDFPTLSIGKWLTVGWSGALTALFVCGRELLPQRREESSLSGSLQPAACSYPAAIEESTSTLPYDRDRQGKAP